MFKNVSYQKTKTTLIASINVIRGKDLIDRRLCRFIRLTVTEYVEIQVNEVETIFAINRTYN